MSSSDRPRRAALDGFGLWVQECGGASAEVRGTCLLDYVGQWLSSGAAVEMCSGDFQIFLSAVAIIIDEWHKRSDLLDYTGDPDKGEPDVVERRVKSVFPEGKHTHQVFDPYYFTAAVFFYKHPS